MKLKKDKPVPTSFRFTVGTRELLDQLAKQSRRSQVAMLEHLIWTEAQRLAQRQPQQEAG